MKNIDAHIKEYENETFEKINCQGQRVEETNFSNCIFKNCTLAEAFFKDCVFDNCVFENCDLSLMKVDKSIFKKLQLNRCKAIGVQWFDSRNPFSVSCTETNISYSSFFGKDLKKAKFISCEANETDFTGCNLTEAAFTGTNLSGARFVDCDLSLANFREAKNYSFDVRQNKLKKTLCSLPEAISLLDYFDIILNP
jgi:fluoroquinolone resistance protein